MAISATRAQALCTQAELDLVLSSRPADLKGVSETRLRGKVDRARKLRDKYRDLAKRQRLEARGKKPPARTRPAAGHARTDEKARLFAEVLERFEKRLAKVATAGAPARKKPSKRVKTATRRQETRTERRGAAQAARGKKRQANRAAKGR
jgi:hypothetical protein